MEQQSRRCEAVTAAGDPCRAWAVRDSERPLCSAHAGRNVGAGAPVGNSNRLEHGFYSGDYSIEELVDLVNLGTDLSLVDEIALSRVRLRRVAAKADEDLGIEEYAFLSDLIFRGAGRVGRLVEQQHRMGGGASLEDLFGDVLDVLGGDWGLEL